MLWFLLQPSFGVRSAITGRILLNYIRASSTQLDKNQDPQRIPSRSGPDSLLTHAVVGLLAFPVLRRLVTALFRQSFSVAFLVGRGRHPVRVSAHTRRGGGLPPA